MHCTHAGTAKLQRLYTNLETTETSCSHACAGSAEVILMCNMTGATVTWTVTSDSTGRIVFFSSDREGQILNQGTIRGILLQNDLLSDGSNLRQFVTQLHVYITQMMGRIEVTCSSENGNSLHVIEPPGVYSFYLIQYRDSNYIYLKIQERGKGGREPGGWPGERE